MLRHHALATARGGATSAVIIAVLTATLLVLIHLESPTAHARAAAPPAASTGGYGSGTLGSWQANAKVISSGAHVRHVVATDGVLLFGDSRNLRIVHWAEFLAARPERMRTDLRDGRHTTVPAGQTARNALILQAIQHG